MKRDRRQSPPYVIIQTYFSITEAPFSLPISLTYGARVAVPAKYATKIVRSLHNLNETFHLMIQIPGAFIVR